MKILLIFISLMFITVVTHAQSKKQEDLPIALEMAAPIYPVPAIHLRLEEKIIAKVKIDSDGKIFSVNFDRGAQVFHTVIEDALKQWKFEESPKKEREANINFIFTLLSDDLNSYVSSVFKSPNTIEIFARRIKVLDSTDR